MFSILSFTCSATFRLHCRYRLDTCSTQLHRLITHSHSLFSFILTASIASFRLHCRYQMIQPFRYWVWFLIQILLSRMVSFIEHHRTDKIPLEYISLITITNICHKIIAGTTNLFCNSIAKTNYIFNRFAKLIIVIVNHTQHRHGMVYSGTTCIENSNF